MNVISPPTGCRGEKSAHDIRSPSRLYRPQRFKFIRSRGTLGPPTKNQRAKKEAIPSTNTVNAQNNIVPDSITLLGELRSFRFGDKLNQEIDSLEKSFRFAATKIGAGVLLTQKQLAARYQVNPKEPLLQAYKKVFEQDGGTFTTSDTFVASDANVFRGEKGLDVFVVSTGIRNDHQRSEEVNISDMFILSQNLVQLLDALSS